MVANFLHHFPQYTLRDLCDGTLGLQEMFWLYAGMMDVAAPETTAPVEQQVAEQTRAAALRAHEQAKRREGW